MGRAAGARDLTAWPDEGNSGEAGQQQHGESATRHGIGDHVIHGADIRERDVLIHDGWVTYPMMKIVNEFEESLKKFPPIKMGTPDPYQPPSEQTGQR